MLPEITRSMLKNSLVLGLFAVVTVGLVAVTQQGTAARIGAAEREAKAQALTALLPAGSYDNHLLVGIKASGQLAGVRVLRHKETPGLGDKIELGKSPWISSFDN